MRSIRIPDSPFKFISLQDADGSFGLLINEEDLSITEIHTQDDLRSAIEQLNS